MKRIFLAIWLCLCAAQNADAALVLADRVQETTTTAGTGTVSLLGAVTGYQTFVAGVGTGNTTYYVISKGADWEIGIGTVTAGAPDTLARTSVINSSNGGALVNFGAGVKAVFVSVPGERTPFASSTNACSNTNADATHFLRGDCTWQVPSGSSFPLLAPNGTVGAPPYSWSGETNAGLYRNGSELVMSMAGVDQTCFVNTQLVVGNGSFSCVTPSSVLGIITGVSDSSVGGTNEFEFEGHRSSADTTGSQYLGKKSRGTPAAPTVITTGDALTSLIGKGFVGAVNTFVEAARIQFTSTGAIADSATGIGGIISFQTRTVGGAVQEGMNLTGNTLQVGSGVLGTANLNTLTVNGTGSGVITLKPQAAAGTWEWDWPTTAGTTGQPLISGGGAGVAMAWGTLTGNTTKFATASGSFVNGNCLKADAASNVVDAGACGGSSKLSAITAASASNVIANLNFSGQVWNWSLTTDSTVAFTYGETASAINGTITSGIPNQAILQAKTLAGSTASPFQVFVRGTYAFGADSTNPQILAANGSCTVPAYSFAASTGTGMAQASNEIRLCSSGTVGMVLDASVGQIYVIPGTTTVAGLTDLNTQVSGLTWSITSKSLSIMNNALETVRWDTTGRQYFKAQVSVPTVNTCTNGSVTGTDDAMLVSFTGNNATCSINFGSSYITNPPVCTASAKTVTATTVIDVVTTAALLTLTGSAGLVNTDTIQVLCFGRL